MIMRRTARNPHFRVKYETRKQRKAAWMRVKNAIAKDPDGQGVFASRHVFEDPMTWIIVVFLSKEHKGVVFSAFIKTLEYVEWNNDGDKAETILAERGICRRERSMPIGKLSAKAFIRSVLERSEEDRAADGDYRDQVDEVRFLENQKPREASPKILIDEWGSVRVAIEAEVDASSLTPEVILAFIKAFRDLGEPIKNKWAWAGPAVEVVPAHLKFSDFSNGVSFHK